MLAAQLAWWKQQMAGLREDLELPTDRPRPAVPTYRGKLTHVAVPAAVTEALKNLGRRQGTTLFMTLLAAFQVLLRAYSRQDDVAVGSPIANRNRAEIEGLIGFFVNTLPLRTDLGGNPTFKVLLERVREVTLGAYAHQDLPFEKLVEELQPERNLSRQPLFQVMFVLQNVPDPTLELSALTIRPVSTESGTSRFDLTFIMAERGGLLQGWLEYSTDLFDATTVAVAADGRRR